MGIMQVDISAIGDRAPELDDSDAQRLCKYGALLAQVAKARAEDEPEDDLTPDELAEKAEKLVRAMREARK